MSDMVSWWQKNGSSGDWENKIYLAGMGTGKSSYAQTYINGILQESQMRVLNKKYWPHQFTMDYKKDIDAMERWCYNNLKSANWRNYNRLFAFKQEQDASYFLLMWT